MNMEQSDLEESYLSDVSIDDCQTVFQEMRDIKNWDKEVFVAFFLDSRRKIISREIVSVGTVSSALIHPREVFRTAIQRNASGLVVAHNHPSGSPDPSEEDQQITAQLKKAGDIIGITLLDHVIVSKDSFYSFMREGEL